MRIVPASAGYCHHDCWVSSSRGQLHVAFDDTLNQYHVLRGLVWNIGAYTTARMLVWWAMAAKKENRED